MAAGVAAATLAATALPPAEAAWAAPTTAAQAPTITGVTYGSNDVAVTGQAAAGATVEVSASSAALAEDGDRTSVSVTAGDDGSFRASLPSESESGEDLRYAEYTATAAGTDSGSHFVDDVTAPSRADLPPTPVTSKKGLQVQLSDDAEDLGVQHAAINVSLGQIMWVRPGSADATLEFRSGGRTFWFSRSALESLDRQVRGSSEAGASVSLIVLVYRSGDPRSAASVLTDPGASAGAGTVMGFNTTTAEGVAHLRAAMELLASRYTQPDRAHGRVDGFIMGNEVDAQWEWSQSGEKTLDEFLDGYSRALRIGWLATTKYSSSARTYVSLTHSWTRPSGPNPDEGEPTRYYAGRDVLDGLVAQGHREGGFPWQVAYHPYPQDLFDPTVWDDPDATEDVDAPVVTFRNLDVLTRYLERPELRFHGDVRRVILSEQGCNTPSGDRDEAERLQAACYAYAYYRTRFLDGIDAFILHRHVDHGAEGGLNLGLWARDTALSDLAAPSRRKLAYEVFRDIDTRRSLQATEFAKDVIGIEDWSEVIPGFDASVLGDRRAAVRTGSVVDAPSRPGRDLAGPAFAGWEADHNVTSVSVTDGALSAAATSYDLQWRGVRRRWDGGLRLGGSRGLAVRVSGVADDEAVARVRVTTSDGRVVDADGRLPADGSARTVTADLRSLPRSAQVAEVQVWVRGNGSTRRSTRMQVEDVRLTTRLSRSTAANLLVEGTLEATSATQARLRLDLVGLDAYGAGPAVVLPCGGWQVDRTPLDLSSLRIGRERSVEVPVHLGSHGNGTVCLDVGGERIQVAVDAPRISLDDLDGDGAGWRPGSAVSAVAVVSAIANAPGRPAQGTGALEATGSAAAPDVVHSVVRTFDTPVDLSAVSMLELSVNSYGGAVGATSYEAVVTVTSADGTTRRTTTSYTPDRWNRVTVDLREWDGASAVSSVEVGTRAVGSTLPAWAPRFQVDDLGVVLGGLTAAGG